MAASTRPIGEREALCLYCFARSADTPLSDLPGVDERRPPFVHGHDGIAAVVSIVDQADYAGPIGEAQLADLAWVAPWALRQEAVLRRVMAAAPVFPMPFGTLFSSFAALEQTIHSRRAAIDAVLERVAGCEEWAVQATLDRGRAIDARVDAAIADGSYVPAPATGRRHLEEQRLRRRLEQDLDSWLAGITGPLLDDLRQMTRGAVARRLVAGQDLAFNWAFLVPVTVLDRFRRRVEEAATDHAALGLELSCKGPLPPYSFCGEAE
jgi:hypothetical protein